MAVSETRSVFKKIFFSIYVYTITYALFGVLSTSYHACFNSSLSTLEKRFHFSSSTGGYIMITDNIATVLTNIFIGYYGKTAHKPRWMAVGCVVTGISVMLTSVPYFIYGPAQEYELEIAGNMTLSKMSTKGDQMCLQSRNEENCSLVSTSATKTMTLVAVACFGISNFFRGFGTSMYYTYGAPYLDDNVSKTKMPLFFAFVFAARLMGAPIGFFMSSWFLKYYENPLSPPSGLVDTDPRWIGAWWIGFLVSGTLMLFLAIPLSFFPREFKKKNRLDPTEAISMIDVVKRTDSSTVINGNENQQVVRFENTVANENQSKKTQNDLSLKELPGEILAIFKNPMILSQMMGNLFRGIGIIGYYVFQTKYLEAQFKQSASKASLVSGTTGFLAKVFGVLFGGAFIALLRPGPRVLTTYIFIVELTSVITLLYGATVLGPQYMYPQTSINTNNLMELNNVCNKDCYCSSSVRYQPVCEHTEMKAYFSPCHAGCRKSFKTADGGSAFTECSCIDHPSRSLEKCPSDTDNLIRYATIVAFGGMVSGSSRSGNLVTFFRAINPDQKSLAVAVGSFWHSLFVSIPYPIIFGRIFDYCCLVWSVECGKQGNCWLYDTEKLRKIYHGFSIVLIALGSVFDLVMIFLSPRLGKLYEDSDSTLGERVKFWKKRGAGGNELSKSDSDIEEVAGTVAIVGEKRRREGKEEKNITN